MKHKKRSDKLLSMENSWPEIPDGTVVALWTHPDGDTRVYLIARPDGTFSRRCESLELLNDKMCWMTDRHDRRRCLYDSETTARHEIEQEYPWILDVAVHKSPGDDL